MNHLRALLDAGSLDLALPGAGDTSARWRRLSDLARRGPIGLARLAEAHTDAVAILAEAGHSPRSGQMYGVWASQSPHDAVVLDESTGRISGTMGFASGVGIVDRALVTAQVAGGQVLLDVDVRSSDDSITSDTAGWASAALVDTATGTVTFTDHRVDSDEGVGQPGWYLSRPGFWQGACGPAACWAGGALGLVDAAERYTDDNPHRQAHRGALSAHAWTLEALLDTAGRQIDADPDATVEMERLARSLRFTVASICRDVLDRFGRAFGPRPYVTDPSIAQRAHDLDLYIKQHHSERELAQIASDRRSSGAER